MGKKVIGYARVSTEKQDLDRQKILIKDYCELQGYDLVKIISEKVSGAKKNRLSISNLMEVDSKMADMIVVSELSRLSRESEIMNLLSIINDLLENGLDILFLDSPNKIYEAYSTLSLIDIITLSVEANAASEERKKISTRMGTGKYTKFQQNPYIYLGGNALPLGFKAINNPKFKDQKDNQEVKRIIAYEPKEVELVKLIYKLIIQGNTSRHTAELLTKMGYKTKLNYLFVEGTICHIIRNPLYNGKRKYKDLVLEIEKIIPDDDWNMANKHLQSNQTFRGKWSVNFNPFKGIAFCPCGYSLMLHKIKWNGDGYTILRCTHQRHIANSYRCHNLGINKDLLLNSVWTVAKQTLNVTEYAQKNSTQRDAENDIINQLEKQIYELTCTQDDLKKDKNRIEKAITMVDLPELVQKYQSQYIELDGKINQLNKQKENIQKEIGDHKINIQKILSAETKNVFNDFTEKDKADLFRKILKRVVYYSVTIYKGFIVIDYTNGFRNILAVKKGKRGYVALLSGFKFNPDNRTVVTTVLTERPKLNEFPLGAVKNIEYDFSALEAEFELKEWDINK